LLSKTFARIRKKTSPQLFQKATQSHTKHTQKEGMEKFVFKNEMRHLVDSFIYKWHKT
jgi:hypothetical protein